MTKYETKAVLDFTKSELNILKWTCSLIPEYLKTEKTKDVTERILIALRDLERMP